MSYQFAWNRIYGCELAGKGWIPLSRLIYELLFNAETAETAEQSKNAFLILHFGNVLELFFLTFALRSLR